MVRSASDATRFTATTPTAYNKAPTSTASHSSTIQNLGHGATPGETPQQKILRLRAAAAAARSGRETNFDRVVRTGRRWADRAHRVTAYSLIGLTVVSGVVASFAIGDMLMHNRRKRAEWLADQQAQHRGKLDEARLLLASGEKITEDQMLLINQERAAQEAYIAQKNKKGILTRAKESLFSTVSEEEKKGGKLLGQAESAFETQVDGAKELGVVKAVGDKVAQTKELANKGVERVEQGLDQVEKKAGEIMDKRPVSLSPSVAVAGGPLDREAEAAAEAVKSKSKSWTDWVLRR
ncbi:hypothetical protein AAFC00_006069 [Neodothiora populina]|uniref:Uncharacterized protein n=1 Tax=Neodothiora populina TaxID=2781224 RepID=A0ABR3P6T4_9PEZI